tara:strand:- start:1369 stop:2115 length:747 start_codon:yes stop_codon:yes gene_type:complete
MILPSISWVAGLDGCKAGWFYILLEQDGDAIDFGVVDCVATLFKQQSISRLWLDMALGFCDDIEGRACEKAARKMLRAKGVSRAASVFNPPSRQALYCETYEQANALNKQVVGKGLSKQAWFIVPKMRELDGFLQQRPDLQSCVDECHPEVAFAALNALAPMRFNKKTAEGYAERLAILCRYYPKAECVINDALAAYPRKVLVRDDVVDAFVVAISAKFSDTAVSCLPEQPQYDELGIGMRMVYWLGY